MRVVALYLRKYHLASMTSLRDSRSSHSSFLPINSPAEFFAAIQMTLFLHLRHIAAALRFGES